VLKSSHSDNATTATPVTLRNSLSTS